MDHGVFNVPAQMFPFNRAFCLNRKAGAGVGVYSSHQRPRGALASVPGPKGILCRLRETAGTAHKRDYEYQGKAGRSVQDRERRKKFSDNLHLK